MLDYVVVIAYLAAIFSLAFVSRRKKIIDGASAEEVVVDQYLASRSLSLVESLNSIIATEVSALTFLGIPAFSFAKDFSFIHIYIGAIFGRFFIARVIVPRIYNKQLTLYAIMAGENATESGARLSALVYFISKLLAVGVRLYAGSLLVAEFFDLNIIWALLSTTLITFFYTLIGGLKAVVRTDLLQTLIFISGGIAAHFIIPQVAGSSWSSLMALASDAGKMTIFSLTNWQPFAIGLIGGFLFDICTHGIDQDFAQRLMGARSQRVAQISIFFSSFFSIAVALIFLGIGSLLWGYYQLTPLAPGVESDKVFVHFIETFFPSPLRGLMLAGVLAATMSTLDSTMNALSSVLWSEIWPKRDITKIKYFLRVDTAVIAVLLLAVAIFASESQGILELGLKIASWSGGSLAALFFSQLVWNDWTKAQLNAVTVVVAYLSNLFGVAINTFAIEGPWQFNVYYGMLAATFALLLMGRSKFKL